MRLQFKNEIKYLLLFIIISTLFVLGSLYMPSNFIGLIFYGIFFFIAWMIMRIVLPKFKLSKKAKTILLILIWFPIFLLTCIVIFGYFLPFSDWASWLKMIITTVTFAFLIAQTFIFVFTLIYLLLRIFFKESKPLRWVLYLGIFFMCLSFILFITSPLGTISPVVKQIDIPIKNLPKNFENFKIVQISDLHLDYATQTFIKKSVAKINEQKPDLVLMTGDMVTFRTKEMDKFMTHLQKIESKNGIYCIMGNHDYGSYAYDEGTEIYNKNIEQLEENYRILNWILLNNEHSYLTIESDTLVIAGTKNQSLKKMFQSDGDVYKTLEGLNNNHPIILMTHDPNYWVGEIYKIDAPIALTLSGHTHGMQIGMNTKWCRWSLYQLLMSNYWGGLYEKEGKRLYINLGLGQTGFPGRIGLRPEISVFRLVPEI